MKFLSAMLFIIALAICGIAQKTPHKTAVTKNDSALISSNKPPVFISFLRKANIKAEGGGGERDYLFFRLTNNTRWSIRMLQAPIDPQFGDVSPYYAIEETE